MIAGIYPPNMMVPPDMLRHATLYALHCNWADATIFKCCAAAIFDCVATNVTVTGMQRREQPCMRRAKDCMGFQPEVA